MRFSGSLHALVHVLQAHGLDPGVFRLAFVRVEQVFRFGEPDIVVKRFEPGRVFPRTVRRLVVAHDHEGLSGVAAVEPAEHLIGDHVGRVALVDRGLRAVEGAGLPPAVFGRDQPRVEVAPLVGHDVVIVESGRFVLEMPFADDGRLVAVALQLLGEVVLLGQKSVVERVDAVQLAVLPRQDAAAAGGADRVGHAAAVHADSLAADAVDVGRGHDLREDASVGADRLRRMVVGHDVDDVGALLLPCGVVRAEQGERQGQDRLDFVHGGVVLRFRNRYSSQKTAKSNSGLTPFTGRTLTVISLRPFLRIPASSG